MEKLFNDSFENWIFDLDNTIYDIKADCLSKYPRGLLST